MTEPKSINEVKMKRPLRKWFFRILLCGFLLFLLAVGYVYWNWKSTRSAGEVRLAKVMKELNESEPGWRDVFEMRNKRLAPKEKNSA